MLSGTEKLGLIRELKQVRGYISQEQVERPA